MCTVLKFTQLRTLSVDHRVIVVQADVRDAVRHFIDGHALPHGVGRLGPREVGVEPDLVDVRPAPRLVARVASIL